MPKSQSSYLKEEQINNILIRAVIEDVHTVIRQLKLDSSGWDSISPVAAFTNMD